MSQPGALMESPHTITALADDPTRPGRVVVDVDGARFASFPREHLEGAGLARVGPLAPPEFAALHHLADVEAAYGVALRLLAARPRAMRDMVRRLRDRGHHVTAATEAVSRLAAAGLLDDEEFARHFARTRGPKGHGPARIVTDLLARGVDKRIAERAVAEVAEAEAVDPVAQARRLAEKRSAQLGDLPEATKRRRLLAFLGRRGFRGYEISTLVTEVIGADRSDLETSH